MKLVQSLLVLLLVTYSCAQYARPGTRRRGGSLNDPHSRASDASTRNLETDDRQDSQAEKARQQDSTSSKQGSQSTIKVQSSAGEGHQKRGASPSRQAYVTMVTTTKYVNSGLSFQNQWSAFTDGYCKQVIGAEVLAKSLRAVKASRPLVALVDSQLPSHVTERLTLAGWAVEYIGHVENKNKDKLQDRPWFNTTFSKLHVFGMEEYDKVIFLDADILLLDNLDSLFDLEIDDDPSHPFAAASEVFPPDSFNSGVLVVSPSPRIFRHLLDEAAHVKSYDGSDQGFLNTVFSRWWSLSAAHRLPFKYNVPQTLPMYFRPAWDSLQRDGLAILHFAGDDSMKPWSFSGVVPPSLARFLLLWQRIARAPLDADVTDIYTSMLGSVGGDAEDGQSVAELFQSEAVS